MAIQKLRKDNSAELDYAASDDGRLASLEVSGKYIQVTYPQFGAADVAKVFFVAPYACTLVKIYESHAVVAGQAGALMIEKLTTGQAPGAGVDMQDSAFDLTSTVNTPVAKNPHNTASQTKLVAGDRIALKVSSGAATSLAGAVVTVLLKLD